MNQKNGPSMTDLDRITDILATQKYLSDGYNVATSEASSSSLFKVQLQLLQETHEAAREIFNLMEKKGWYTLEPEDHQQKITKKIQQFSDKRSQFPY